MSDLVFEARELLGADVRPLDGGYSGETFLVGAAGEQAVLRLHVRQPERAQVNVALLQLVRGILPVPRVLDAKPAIGEAPAYVLLELLPGIRLDTFLAEERDPALLARAGRETGVILARLSGMPFLKSGEFADADLTIRPWPPGMGGLPEFVESHRTKGRLAGWTADDFAALIDIAVDAQVLLDTHDRVCLCHSDFNPKNLLVDPATGEITGLLDWEFAHAGMPHADLGNLLRFETAGEFCHNVVASYREHLPGPPDGMLELGRAADLFALVDLAGRERTTRVTELATLLLRSTVESGNLAAGRPDWESSS